MRFFLVFLLLFSTAARSAELDLQLGGVETRVWLPEGEGKAPLILFSHGFGGCPGQSKFLTRALAAAGYIVVAPRHRDAACGIPGKPQMPFSVPELWEPSVFVDRRDDIFRIVAALKADSSWAARIDWTRIGAMGHSLGGYTALGLAGAVPGWQLPGVDAVLVMSPYCTPFLYRGGLEKLRVPVMYQGGSRDKPITPTVTRRGGCYDRTPGPAWYVEIARAWHLSWTDINMSRRSRQAITSTAIGFFDSALRRKGGVAAVPGLTSLRRK
jgi:predicted dienelactone hydrolase